MSSISAGTSAGSALVSTGDTTGVLQLQVNGTTPSITLAANGSIGVGSTPGYGTAGQVLTSSGSGSSPTWAAAGLSLVSTQTASSSAFIEWTGLSGSNQYLLIFSLLYSTAASTNITLGTGATPTYLSAGYGYGATGTSNASGNGAGYASVTTATTSAWATMPLNASASTSVILQAMISGLTSGTPAFTGSVGGQNGSYANYGYGYNVGGFNTNASSSTPITAIKITPNSGTYTSGTASLYRIGA